MNIELNTLVGEVVKENFNTAKVFEDFNIDYCCGGNISISKACQKTGTDSNVLIPKLLAIVDINDADSKYFNSLPLDELCNYIIKRHHSYVNENLPYIQQKLQKLCEVHGNNHPELFEVRELFDGAAGNLSMHMQKEELVLFPHIKNLIKQTKSKDAGALENFKLLPPIQQMEAEHEIEGRRFEKIAGLTNNYTSPADACNTYRVTMHALKNFEKDLHRHIHLENNILFKKAITFEDELAR